MAEQVGTAEGAAGPEDRARLAAFGLRIKLLRVSRGWSQEHHEQHRADILSP